MNLKLIIPIFFIVVYISAQKTDLNKSIFTIPTELTKNANIVTRFKSTNVHINSEDNMTITYNMFFTVYNKYGDTDPLFFEYYDNHATITNIKILIYDANGKLRKKVKKKEINDISATNENVTLFSDDRLKYYKHIPNQYPYSIEISYKVTTSNTAFIPKWNTLNTYFQSIQKSSYTISYPQNLKLNYKEYNFESYPVKSRKQDNSIQYSISNIEAIRKEPMAPKLSKITPNVIFATNNFSLAGEKGYATNWKEFGKWMYEKLLIGRNELPQETKNKIKALVKGVEDPIERAKIVYKYMQDKTRYISVQIGIGGWKPMLSKDVDKLGYGDCKALSYYTKSLMDAANVKSVYTIVYAGDKKNIKKHFTSVQGNHAILMLPTKKDTIWLECTSQDLPFGQTGRTDDRDVLIINDEGGKIVHTNTYDDELNYQKITGNYTIGEKGTINAEIEIKNSGKQYNYKFYLQKKDKKDQIIYYKNQFSNILDVDIDKIEFVNNKTEVFFTEKIKLKAINYTEFIGDDIMLQLNAFNISENLPERVFNRKLPLEIKKGFKKEDVIEITIPKNYKIGNLPNNIVIENKFGKYLIELTKISDYKLIYKRILKIKEAKYAKTEYTSFRKFMIQINKNDNLKIILQKI